DPVAMDHVAVRPPEGWSIEVVRPTLGWPFSTAARELELLAREPGADRVRTLRVRTFPGWTYGDRFASLFQLIDLPGAVEFVDAVPIPFAGAGRGYLLQAEQPITGQRVGRQYLIAMGTADQQTAVSVVLEVPHRLTDDDFQLISRVALSLRPVSDR
ncbi:MAG TPA: hypothetical protein PKB10_02455, partial [Tepidisphaeraceae bacterium]|nr:hypothetical protein [Tepidisphaeraceae bacterium]